MAEFCEVLDNWRRMCNYYDEQYKENACEYCHCKDLHCCAVYELEESDDILAIEQAVQQWALRHPKPLYPTWSDWIFEKYGSYDGVNQRIPQELAKKLGISPLK